MSTRIRVVLIGLAGLSQMCACATIFRDLGALTGGAVDEAFEQLEKLHERSAEREAAYEVEQREKRAIDERLVRTEQGLGRTEAMLQDVMARFGAFESSVGQQLPKIWDRLREDASKAQKLFQEESKNRLQGDEKISEHLFLHASESSTRQANLDSLLLSFSRHVQKSERDASATAAEIQTTKYKIESSIEAVNASLRESRRDTIMLFSAIIGGLALVFAIYQAIKAGQGREQPALTAKTKSGRAKVPG